MLSGEGVSFAGYLRESERIGYANIITLSLSKNQDTLERGIRVFFFVMGCAAPVGNGYKPFLCPPLEEVPEPVVPAT